MSTSLEVGHRLELGKSTWHLIGNLGPDAWLAHEVGKPEHHVWIWFHKAQAWLSAIKDALPTTHAQHGLPAILDHGARKDIKWVVLKPCAQDLDTFTSARWLELETLDAINALQGLAKAIELLHRSKVSFGGLERGHLRWNPESKSICVVMMPGATTIKGKAEEVWRDLRCIGELLMEFWTGTTAPSGQKVAQLVQDKEQLKAMELIQPGLAQIIAGCVTPYGDAALGSGQDVWASLELLKRELAPRIQFKMASRSTLGNYIFRKNNQDACSYLVVDDMCGSHQRQAGFFCVADGIGGLDDGELASRCAAQSSCETFMRFWLDSDIRHQMFKYPSQAVRAIAHQVSCALAEEVMNKRFQEHDEDDWAPSFSLHGRGGTTFSAMVVADELFGIAHVGDSRIHLFRDGELIQLTEDHTLIALVEELSKIDPDKAPNGPVSKSTIARFLNTRQEIEQARIDSFSLDACDSLDVTLDQAVFRGIPWQVGDRFLLTSDGTHGEVEESVLAELLGVDQDVNDVCALIFKAAVEAMGTDNITVMVVEISAQRSAIAGL